jgi:hypothetical protein
MPLASITSFIDQHSQWALLLMFVLLAGGVVWAAASG